jgi:hypothetical protein
MNELWYSHSTIVCTCDLSPAFMPLKYKHRYLVSKSERQDGIVVLKKKDDIA